MSVREELPATRPADSQTARITAGADRSIRGGARVHIRNREQLIELMDRWARYRLDRQGNNGVGWPRQTILGKLRDGMPGTGCPTCGGTGKAPGDVYGLSQEKVKCQTCQGEGKLLMDLEADTRSVTTKCRRCIKGEINGRTCSLCKGTGMRVHVEHKVNPAGIMPTGHLGSRTYDDPLSQRVDWLVCTAITEDERVIVMAEFTWNGNRNDKLRQMRIVHRLCITHSAFNEWLDSALDKIQSALEENP